MNNLESIYFSILRSALWNTPLLLQSPLSNKMWNEVYTISKEQTITGIMLDAVSTLPNEQKPGINMRMQWIAQLKVIEAQNKKMNTVLVDLINELEKFNIKPYLLKGQGVAQNYPAPMHRICGDIDLYFEPEDFNKALEFFESKGYELEGDPEDAHTETSYCDIKVELHKKSATFYTRKLQERYNSIILDIIGQEKAKTTTIEGKVITVLPPMANALQLLSHMLRHIIVSGLGLRQVCDWVFFVHKHWSEIDKDLFSQYTKELQLWETYKAITAIATDYLGLPKEYTVGNIGKREIKNAKKILRVIMEYGNFGHYGEHSAANSKTEYLKSYIWKVKNAFHLRSLSKSEAWNYPLWQLHSVKNVIQK